MNISGTDGGQFNYEKVISTAFIFLWGALGGSSEEDKGQFHHENVISTAFIFLMGALRGSSEAVLSRKSYIHCIYFSLTAMGKLGGSQGFTGAAQGHIGGSFIGKKLCARHIFFFEYLGD